MLGPASNTISLLPSRQTCTSATLPSVARRFASNIAIATASCEDRNDLGT